MTDLFASSLSHDLGAFVALVCGVPALMRLIFWGTNA